MSNIEDDIKQMPTIAELIQNDPYSLPTPFQELISSIFENVTDREGYIKGESEAITIGVAVALGDIPAFGRNGTIGAIYERITPDFAIFHDLDLSTSSVTAIRGEESTRWHEVRLCHPVDVPPMAANIAWLKGGTPLDMIYKRYVLNDPFVIRTRNAASNFYRPFGRVDASFEDDFGMSRPIITPPWRRDGHAFRKAYWETIQATAKVSSPVPENEMPEAVRLFITAVRYPLHRLLFLLDRGDLVGHGIHPLTKVRKRIERLFWRRENISIDFATGDIFSSRTGELEWGYVTITAADDRGSIRGGTVSEDDDFNKNINLGRKLDKYWLNAFDYLCNHPDEKKKLHLDMLPKNTPELAAMLLIAHEEINTTVKKDIDGAQNWIYHNLRPLTDIIIMHSKQKQ